MPPHAPGIVEGAFQNDSAAIMARRQLDRDSRAERTGLQREQRAWLKHHLAETARLAADPDNGSVAFLDSQSFELDDLSKRTLELEARVHRDR